MDTNTPMNFGDERAYPSITDGQKADAQLDEMFRAYRTACPDPEGSVNFMPGIWARIEAREVSTNWFGRVAKALVTAAIAASVILGMMTTSANQSSSFFDATFVEALRADHVSSLEPLHLDRISYMEQQ
jgi:anti-sigma factor RsiW